MEITHLATLLGRMRYTLYANILIYLECYIPWHITFLNGDSVLAWYDGNNFFLFYEKWNHKLFTHSCWPAFQHLFPSSKMTKSQIPYVRGRCWPTFQLLFPSSKMTKSQIPYVRGRCWPTFQLLFLSSKMTKSDMLGGGGGYGIKKRLPGPSWAPYHIVSFRGHCYHFQQS